MVSYYTLSHRLSFRTFYKAVQCAHPQTYIHSLPATDNIHPRTTKPPPCQYTMGAALDSFLSYLRVPLIASSGIAALLSGVLYFKQKYVDHTRLQLRRRLTWLARSSTQGTSLPTHAPMYLVLHSLAYATSKSSLYLRLTVNR